jgi:hypothetical protein
LDPFAGGLAADSIDYEEGTVGGVDPVTVFVVVTDEAGIGGGSAIQRELSHGEPRRRA